MQCCLLSLLHLFGCYVQSMWSRCLCEHSLEKPVHRVLVRWWEVGAHCLRAICAETAGTASEDVLRGNSLFWLHEILLCKDCSHNCLWTWVGLESHQSDCPVDESRQASHCGAYSWLSVPYLLPSISLFLQMTGKGKAETWQERWIGKRVPGHSSLIPLQAHFSHETCTLGLISDTNQVGESNCLCLCCYLSFCSLSVCYQRWCCILLGANTCFFMHLLFLGSPTYTDCALQIMVTSGWWKRSLQK